MKKQPLLVHLVFHPESDSARELARHIHRQFNGDGMVPGLSVPTVFCEVLERNRPASGCRFGHAERDVVIVLADDRLSIDDDWSRFVGNVCESCKEPVARFLPVQLTSNAWPLDERMSGVNFARAFDQPEGEIRNSWIVRRIMVELCRYLSDLDPVAKSEFKVPIQLFLSHTKVDLGHGDQATQQVINCLKADQPIETWVDSGDIPTGSEFAKAIESGIARTSLLVILTDAYATREWCREEILLAKEHQRPVVVIDALNGYETRSFPYLGNVPRIRWDGDPQKGIDLLLKETLRHLHDTAVLNRRKETDDVVFARPPELATLVGMRRELTVLYPDPPVGIGEQKRLSKVGVSFVTPLQRLATDRLLAGLPIVLSMSESADIALCGMDPLHLDRCMLELSRYLLIKGATLAYGGHLGERGYTESLFELVRSNNSFEGVQPFERIVNYRGWPLPSLTIPQQAKLKTVAKTIQLPRPADVNESLHPEFVCEPSFFPAEKSPEHRFAWARGMTEMRAYQADFARSNIAARIVLGGTFGPTMKANEDNTMTEKWYMSRIPGVLEEILLSIQYGQPVFLIGAFGGIAKLVIDLLRGRERVEATWDFQQHAPHAPEMRELYKERGVEWIDYPEIISLIRNKGAAGINPLLSVEEQEELFDALDPVRITELVLLGLGRLV